MNEREIDVPTADGTMTTFVAHPDGDGPYPLAILFMDGVGYREQIRENARRFAQAGYFVAAPDLFHRAGKGITFDFGKMLSGDAEEGKRMMATIALVTPQNVEADADAVLDVVAKDTAAKSSELVCVGYCMGARAALHFAATHSDVAAAAGIHPGALYTDAPDSPHRELDTVDAELYFVFAEQDRSATPENVAAFGQAMKDAGVEGNVERLPGTAHGFAMADLPVYNRDASERHFERTLDLWNRAVKS